MTAQAIAAGAPATPRIEHVCADLPSTEVAAAMARYTRAVAMSAYLYGIPAFLHLRQLTEFIAARRALAPAEEPLAGWLLMRALADPSTATVSPNVDTLYGASHLLLDQQGPVLLTVPVIRGRYWSVALMDAWFGNFAVIGGRAGERAAGRYLIVPPGWRGTVPAGVDAVLEAPTPAVCLIQRIYLADASEYGEVHRLQDSILLRPLDDGRHADLTAYDITGVRETTDPLRFFQLVGAFTAACTPPVEDARLVELFRSCGVGPGGDLAPVGGRRALAAGARDARDAIDAVLSAPAARGGWRLPDPAAGRTAAPLLQRAATQLTQLGLLPLEEATYFFAYTDADGQPLDGGRSYRLTFPAGSLPPHDEPGFWSVTMYDERSLLAANEIGRHAVRPQTPGLTRDADGRLTLLLQHRRPSGGAEGNWLPAPAGRFVLALRVYLPTADVLDGRWLPPPPVAGDGGVRG